MTQVFGNKLAPVAAGYAELGLSVFPVQDGLICVENPKIGKSRAQTIQEQLEICLTFTRRPTVLRLIVASRA